jgi:hypothetical protein
MKLRNYLVLVSVLVFASTVAAQDRARILNASISENQQVNSVTDPTFIPAGSKVYVNYIDGMPAFENNLVAAFQKKKVNLIVVTDRSQADFEVNGFAHSQQAGWVRTIFGSGLPESEANMQLVNLRTGVVAFAVASYKVNSPNGNKSTAEHLAKNLRQKMERDEKKLRK